MRLAIVLAAALCVLGADAQQVVVTTNPATGGVSQITIDTDPNQMNWVMATDGSQYPWVTEEYAWGLGYFTECRNHTCEQRRWRLPVSVTDSTAVYREGGIEISVTRTADDDGGFVETYRLRNAGNEAASVQNASIYTPFNDNYPDSRTCLTNRANAHIWASGDASWVNAMCMGAQPPHLGLALTQGALQGYDIHLRGRDRANSQYRGVISLNLPDIWLAPGESYTLQWRIFPHLGYADFDHKMAHATGVSLRANRYVLEAGGADTIFASTPRAYANVECRANGRHLEVHPADGGYMMLVSAEAPGPIDIEFAYDGKKARAELLAVSSEDSLIWRRAEFILDRQQMPYPADPRYGAYMIYDLDGDSIYLNDTPNCNPVDRDEGAERVGMGVLMAKLYRLTGNERFGESVKRYARFVREKLQTPDYVTYSSVDQTNRNRGYNYMWVAELYFQLYMATGEKQYAIDGYRTLDAMFRQFGHTFYAIGIPVSLSLDALEQAGMDNERKRLMDHYKRLAETMLANGLDYPPFEVNYEQSIVAPAVQFLTQMHTRTGDPRYLAEVERQLPVLEAFNGTQPSYHLNDIAVRHWDGYWFGKRELFGDTFPHYWSTLTAAAFYNYYRITGNKRYLERAQNIVRNNLCLFFEDGGASCAYLYPTHIDGAKAQFYDPYANDQDWALVYYLLIFKGL